MEMSRAVRLALWDYKPGSALTTACDKDVDTVCPKVRGSGSVASGRRLHLSSHPGGRG